MNYNIDLCFRIGCRTKCTIGLKPCFYCLSCCHDLKVVAIKFQDVFGFSQNNNCNLSYTLRISKISFSYFKNFKYHFACRNNYFCFLFYFFSEQSFCDRRINRNFSFFKICLCFRNNCVCKNFA